MGAAVQHVANQQAVNNAVNQAGKGFRPAGAKSPMTMAEAGTDILESMIEVPRQIGTNILNTPEHIKNTPIGPGVSIPDVAKVITKGDKTQLQSTLERVVGINVRDIVSVQANKPREAQIDDFLRTVKGQVVQEIRNCIEKHLWNLRAKSRTADILLDIQGYIRGIIGEARSKINRRINKAIHDQLLGKWKLWQASLFWQHALTEFIRKICPPTHGHKAYISGDISPTLVRRYQTDPTWQIVDGVTPVSEIAKNYSPDHAVFADDPNSTGKLVEATVEDIMIDMKTMALKQSAGFNDTGVDSFINSDGTIDTTYVNNDGQVIDAADTDPKVVCK